MTDYSKYTLADIKALSREEFEKYARAEYNAYLEDIKSQEDYIPYGEYIRELEAIVGRLKTDTYL